jgi:hypothetical protein
MTSKEELNKKKAPQRLVVDIERVGNWGKVEYRHRLECGHVEIRKRQMPTPRLSCVACVLAAQMGDRVSEIAIKSAKIIEPMEVGDILPEDSYVVSGEIDISKAQAAIAMRIGVPLESVDVAAEIGEDGILRISYATIFIESSLVYRLIRGEGFSQ